MPANDKINLQVGYSVDQQSLNKVKSSLQDLQKMKIADFSGTSAELKKVQDIAKQVEKALTKAFNVNLNSLNISKFNQSLKTAKISVNDIYTEFSKAGAQGKVAFSRMASSILTTNMQLKQTHSIISQMGEAMANTIRWGIASSVMNSFTSSVQQAFQYVQSLDAALTDIRIVTGDSTEQMQQFAAEANKAAQSLGRSTMDYSKAALTFYQQGLDEQSVQARTQATLQAQNITGAGDEMADYLTAVWNGYKVANEEAELYVDKLAAVADSSASNMSQLAVAMSKVASTANAMGVDVDSLNAQIATIVATTRQAPESVGNALKTIYARINDISTGAEGAEVSLGNYSKQMAAVGFSVLDANGNLRDTGDVIDQIGGKWQDLSREQQIYLARTMAGQRQYNNLIALFDNWSRYSDLVNVSMDAQGALVEKNSRYMDSLGAKMEQLGAAGQRVKAALINEEDLKGLITVGTDIVNIFGSFIESIGGGAGALLNFGSIFTRIFSGTIANQLNNIILHFQQVKVNANTINQQLEKIQLLEDSKGYSQGTITEMVNAQSKISGLHKLISNEERNAYNEMVRKIGASKEEILLLQEQVKLGTALKESFEEGAEIAGMSTSEWAKGAIESFKDVDSIVKDLNTQSKFELDIDDFNILDTYIDEFSQSISDDAIPAIDTFKNKLKEVNESDNVAPDALEELRDIANQIVSQFNTGADAYSNVDELAGQLEIDKDKLKELTGLTDEFARQKQQAFNIKQGIEFVSALGRIASGVNNVINLFKIWNNESLSTGEKLTQTLTNLTITVPMLVTGIGSAVKAYKEFSSAIVRQITLQELLNIAHEHNQFQAIKTVAGLDAESEANLRATYSKYSNLTATEALTLGMKRLAASIWKAIAPAAPFIAIAAGLAVAIYAVHKAWVVDAEAAQKAAKAAQQAKKSYDSVKESVNDLKTSLDGYNDAIDNLNSLTKGTQQWKDALIQVNNQVIDLLDKFPELAAYVSTTQDGLLQISDEGQRYIQEQYNQRAQVSGLAYINARRNNDEAIARSNITDLYHNEIWGSGLDISKETLQNIVQAVQQQGSSVLRNTDQLKQLGLINDAEIQKIQDLSGQINALANQTNANTQATNALSDSYHQNIIDTTHYQGNYGNEQQFKELVQQALESAESTLDHKYQIYDGNAGTYIDDEKALIKRYNEIMGTNATAKFGGGFKDAQGNKLDADVVKNTVMVQDALENLGNTEAEVNQKIKQVEASFGDLSGAALQLALDMDQATTDAMSAIDIQKIRDEINAEIDGEAKYTDEQLQELFGKSKEQLNNQLDDFTRSLSRRSMELRASLTKTAKEAYDGLNNKELTYSAREAIANYLNKGLVGAGRQGLNAVTDIFEQLDSDQINAFNDLANGLDYSTMTVNDLRQAFINANLQINASDESLQAFINSMKELQNISPEQNYKNIHDIINDIGFEGIIDQQQINTLKTAGIQTDALFEKLLDGTYRLRVDAEDFYRYANQASLQPFRDQIDSLRYLSTNGENIVKGPGSFSQTYNQTTGQLETTKYAGNVNDTDFDNLQAKLDTLKLNNLLPEEELADLSTRLQDEISSKAQAASGDLANEIGIAFGKALAENPDLLSQQHIDSQLNGIFAQMGSSATSMQEVHQLFAGYQDLASAAGIAAAAIDRLNEEAKMDGLQNDKVVDFAEYLQQASKQADDLSEQLETNAQAAEEVAISIMNMNDGIDTLAQNFETWNDVLQNSSESSYEYYEAVQGVKGVLQDLLGLSQEQISTDFATDAQTLALLGQAANGSGQAIDQLRANLIDDVIANIDLEDNDFYNDLNALEADINAFKQANIDGLEVGATLDNSSVIDSLNQMIEASGMTQEQVNQLLAGMNVSATFVTESQPQKIKVPEYITQTVDAGSVQGHYVTTPAGQQWVPGITRTKTHTYQSGWFETDGYVDAYAMSTGDTVPQIKSITKLPPGNFNNYSSKNAGGKSAGGSGGSKGKSGGSSKQKKDAKTVESNVKIEKVEPDYNPYEQVDKQYERQSDIIDKLEKQEKKLVNKDRLKNLKDQNKALNQQANIIQKKLNISNDPGKKNTVAWYAQELRNAFDNISFDSDGQIADRNAVQKRAAQIYNAQLNAQQAVLDKAEQDYNDWINNVYNKASAEEQERLQKEKELREQAYKDIETEVKEKLSNLKEEYNNRLKLLDTYEKQWQMQQKLKDELDDIKDKIYELAVESSKIKVDLAVDIGDADRAWLDFKKKFIKHIDDDDIFGNALFDFEQLNSYLDSTEIKNRQEEINGLTEAIARLRKMPAGSTITDQNDPFFGYNLAEAEKRLTELKNDQMDAFMQIRDLMDSIADRYLDALDGAKDKMDDLVDQYERVNSIIDHNVKLTQLLYGDKAYDTLDKYYNLQKTNNEQELANLRQQQAFWQNQMASYVDANGVITNQKAFDKAKKNVDDITDKLNSKLEEMIQNLTKKWQNRVNGIIDKLNNSLTGGRGLDYLDEEWDYINQFDDAFLDTVESKMGVQEVQTLYQQAIDGLTGSPKQQQKINKLMNDQLKILREKNNLTQYDIDRAKAALEVEKARLALEDARENKTKMRLRRDSQGNYTYQYVADEEKLTDLQKALADTQANLYNMDKEHYRQNLNDMTDAYRDYVDKMQSLYAELQQAEAAGDQAAMKRIQDRINLATESFNKIYAAFSEDNEYTLGQYLPASFADALDLDKARYSADEFYKIMTDNIPIVGTGLQDLIDKINNKGGLVEATKGAMAQIKAVTADTTNAIQQTLQLGGTSVDTVMNAIDENGNPLDANLANAQAIIPYYDSLIDKATESITKVKELMDEVDKAFSTEDFQTMVEELAKAHNVLLRLFGVDGEASLFGTSANNTLVPTKGQDVQLASWGMDATVAADYNNLVNTAPLIAKTLASPEFKQAIKGLDSSMSDQDIDNILQLVNRTTAQMGAAANQQLASVTKEVSGYIGNIEHVDYLDQNVHIEANFPNATSSAEIEQAFRNLVNIASQKASVYQG